jgi:hypothetical protein
MERTLLVEQLRKEVVFVRDVLDLIRHHDKELDLRSR